MQNSNYGYMVLTALIWLCLSTKNTLVRLGKDHVLSANTQPLSAQTAGQCSVVALKLPVFVDQNSGAQIVPLLHLV